MNKVILIGRLAKDPDIRTGTNNITIARYTLAVERQYRKDNEWKASVEATSLKALAQFRRQHRKATHLLNRLTIRIYRLAKE